MIITFLSKDKLTGFCPDPGKYLGDYQTVHRNAACTCSAFVTSPIPYYCIQGCKILQKSHLLIKFLSFPCCYKTQTAVECLATLGITSYFSPHNWRAEPPSSKETPETRIFVRLLNLSNYFMTPLWRSWQNSGWDLCSRSGFPARFRVFPSSRWRSAGGTASGPGIKTMKT